MASKRLTPGNVRAAIKAIWPSYVKELGGVKDSVYVRDGRVMLDTEHGDANSAIFDYYDEFRDPGTWMDNEVKLSEELNSRGFAGHFERENCAGTVWYSD